MTSSGAAVWGLDNNSILIEAFSRVGISSVSITQEQTSSAIRSLNLELQSWSNKGPSRWLVELATVPLVEDVATYDLPEDTVYILEAYIRTNLAESNQNDRIVTPLSVNDYAAIPNKLSSGLPTVYWFDRQIIPRVTFWEVPNGDTNYYFQYYRMRRAQDAYPTNAQTPDIPYRFIDALCAGVAARLARKYAPSMVMDLKMEAEASWQQAAGQDVEDTPLYIRPMLNAYYQF